MHSRNKVVSRCVLRAQFFLSDPLFLYFAKKRALRISGCFIAKYKNCAHDI